MKFAKIWAIGALVTAMIAGASFAQGPGGRGGRGGGRGMVGLLSMPEVQKELKLDEAQNDLLKQLGQEMEAKGRAMFSMLRDLPREEQEKRISAFRADQEKKVAEILDAKQMSRLRQLDLQQSGTSALGRKDVQDALKLTAEQRQRLGSVETAARERGRAEFEKIRMGGQTMNREQLGELFRKLRTESDAQMLAVLTDAQKKQFESMKGAAFQFPERRFGGPGGGQRPNN